MYVDDVQYKEILEKEFSNYDFDKNDGKKTLANSFKIC